MMFPLVVYVPEEISNEKYPRFNFDINHPQKFSEYFSPTCLRKNFLPSFQIPTLQHLPLTPPLSHVVPPSPSPCRLTVAR